MRTSDSATPPGRTDPLAVPAMECPAGRWWTCALLGTGLIAMGAFVFYNVVVASLVTAMIFSAALIVGGALQVFHGATARTWGSAVLSLVVGLLFVAGGLLMLFNPVATSLGLTLGVGVLLLLTGALRLVVAWRHWGDFGWMLLISGLFGIATAVVLFLGFPWSGLVVPGLLLGLDLILHGAWWAAVGIFVRRPPQTGTGESVAVSS